MDGILLYDKPINETSRKSANNISVLLNEKKVGYVGTLDPFASGLLIVAIGRVTKSLAFFNESVKEYIATLVLGKRTETLDNESEVIEEKDVPELTEAKIKEVLNSFLGESEQLPPMTSAIHVNGKRLYEYAHKGVEIDRPTRKIYVYDIKLLEYNKKTKTIKFSVKVSSGTYIRVLGNDIANKLGTVGYLNELRRTTVDCFSVSEANTFEELKSNNYKLYSVYEILSRFIEAVEMDDEMVDHIKNGRRTFVAFKSKNDTILVSDKNKNAIAIYKKEGHRYRFVRGLF